MLGILRDAILPYGLDGIESIKMSSTLAKSFLRGYGEEILTKEAFQRLPSLL